MGAFVSRVKQILIPMARETSGNMSTYPGPPQDRGIAAFRHATVILASPFLISFYGPGSYRSHVFLQFSTVYRVDGRYGVAIYVIQNGLVSVMATYFGVGAYNNYYTQQAGVK